MESRLDVLTLRTVITALPAAALVVDGHGEVVAVNRRARADFAISPPASDVTRFAELAMSYRVPGLRAGLEALKISGEAAWLPDLSVAIEGAATQSMRIFLAPLDLASGGRAILVHMESRDEVDRLRQEHLRALVGARNVGQSRRERLESDNDSLRCDNERLQASYEDLQIRREELLARCEDLQAANDRLHARVAELERRPRAQRPARSQGAS
jgi:hypothetical protein